MAHGGKEVGLGAIALLGIGSGLGKLGNETLVLTDIAQGTDEKTFAVHDENTDGKLKRNEPAILVQAFDFPADADDFGDARSQVVREISIMPAAMRFGHQHRDIVANEFGRVIAQYAFHGRIGRADETSAIDVDDAVHLVVQEGSYFRLAFSQDCIGGGQILSAVFHADVQLFGQLAQRLLRCRAPFRRFVEHAAHRGNFDDVRGNRGGR